MQRSSRNLNNSFDWKLNRLLIELLENWREIVPTHRHRQRSRFPSNPLRRACDTLIGIGEQVVSLKGDNMVKFINLCPHPLRLRVNVSTAASPDATDLVVEPRRGPDNKVNPARVPSRPGAAIDGGVGGVPAFGRTQYATVEGLPDPEDGVVYLVSVMFAGRVGNRGDVFIPGTGPQDGAVRTAEGHVFAVTRLNQA